MRLRRILAAVVGSVQTGLGLIVLLLATILATNFLGIQTNLEVHENLLPLYLLILVVFGFLSVTSGLFLLHDGLRSHTLSRRQDLS